jgi:hypothetical protein
MRGDSPVVLSVVWVSTGCPKRTHQGSVSQQSRQLGEVCRRAAGLVACARLSPQQAERDVDY